MEAQMLDKNVNTHITKKRTNWKLQENILYQKFITDLLPSHINGGVRHFVTVINKNTINEFLMLNKKIIDTWENEADIALLPVGGTGSWEASKFYFSYPECIFLIFI